MPAQPGRGEAEPGCADFLPPQSLDITACDYPTWVGDPEPPALHHRPAATLVEWMIGVQRVHCAGPRSWIVRADGGVHVASSRGHRQDVGARHHRPRLHRIPQVDIPQRTMVIAAADVRLRTFPADQLSADGHDVHVADGASATVASMSGKARRKRSGETICRHVSRDRTMAPSSPWNSRSRGERIAHQLSRAVPRDAAHPDARPPSGAVRALSLLGRCGDARDARARHVTAAP
jgi:hypothetical protein